MAVESDWLKAAAMTVGRCTAVLGVGAVVTYCGAGVASASEDRAATSSDAGTSANTDRTDDTPKRRDAEGSAGTPDESAAATPTTTPGDHETDQTDEFDDADEADKFDDADEADEADEADVEIADDAEDEADVEQEDAADDETVDSADTVVTPISDVEVVVGGDDDTAPQVPVSAPALLTVVGSARRDAETDAPGKPALETSAPVGAQTADIGAAPAQDPDSWQQLYTGKPSFVHEVVVAALKVIQFVLKPFGGLLRFTSLKIPVFTDGIPPFYPWNVRVERTQFDEMPVWSLTPKGGSDDVVIALHGGSYEGQVNIFQWWGYTDMARDTGATVVVPLYTLAPKGTAATEVPRTADFIEHMIALHGADNVSVLGDSAGGGLALASVQELVRRNAAIPNRLVLLAPWLDVSMSDPRSAQIDDPLLDIPNLARAGRDWAGELDVSDPVASPLFGSLAGLPPTYVYSSSRDLLTVDTLRLRDRVLVENIPDMTFRLRRGLIHDYPIFPFLPDAVAERDNIYRDLLGLQPVSTDPADLGVAACRAVASEGEALHCGMAASAPEHPDLVPDLKIRSGRRGTWS